MRYPAFGDIVDVDGGGRRLGAKLIDTPGASNGEHPGPETLFVAAKTMHAPDDAEPGIRRDILGEVPAQRAAAAAATRLGHCGRFRGTRAHRRSWQRSRAQRTQDLPHIFTRTPVAIRYTTCQISAFADAGLESAPVGKLRVLRCNPALRDCRGDRSGETLSVSAENDRKIWGRG